MYWGLYDPSLKKLVDWVQLRWTVERYHQDTKQELWSTSIKTEHGAGCTIIAQG
jgi:hypothetical protein